MLLVFRFWLTVFVGALVAMPAAARSTDKDYMGADGGYLIYSVGTIRIGMDFDFSYRRTSTLDGQLVKDWKGKIKPKLGGAIYLKIKNPDFSGKETGHVVIRRLPPGRYEVHSFFFGGPNLAGTTYSWSPAKPFSLPFDVKSGEATYIGSFMRSPSLGTPLQAALGAAGFFVVADRSERDLPIAKRRLAAPIKATVQVTDVSMFGNQALQASQP
jgi:hypothetical protein